MYGTVRLFAHPANLPTVSRVDRFFGTCADVHGDSDYVRKEYRGFFCFLFFVFEGETLRRERETVKHGTVQCALAHRSSDAYPLEESSQV